MKKVLILSCMVVGVFSAIGINYHAKQKPIAVNPLFMANICALSNSEEGETQKEYRWSNDIECPGVWTGDYNVCQVNGYGNICNEPGGVNCTCGENCD